MNLIDAIKSGRRFRRKTWADIEPEGNWCHIAKGADGEDEVQFMEGRPTFHAQVLDLTADDWEIEERKVEITKTQLIEAHSNALKETQGFGVATIGYLTGLLRELGLEPK